MKQTTLSDRQKGVRDSGNSAWVDRDSSSEKVTFELRSEWWGGANHIKSNGREFEPSHHNSSKVAMSLAYLRNKKKRLRPFSFQLQWANKGPQHFWIEFSVPASSFTASRGPQGLNYVLTLKHVNRIRKHFLLHQNHHLFFKIARAMGTR